MLKKSCLINQQEAIKGKSNPEEMKTLLEKIAITRRAEMLANPAIPEKVIPAQVSGLLTKHPLIAPEVLAKSFPKAWNEFKAGWNQQPEGIKGLGVIERYASGEINLTHKPIPEALYDVLKSKGMSEEKALQAKLDFMLMDENKVTKLYSGFVKILNDAVPGLGTFVLSFHKVPVNVALREFMQTDLGVVYNLTKQLGNLKENPEVATKAIAKILGSAAAIHGSGAILANLGLITGNYDPKLAAYYKNNNIPWNSINVTRTLKMLSGDTSAKATANDWYINYGMVGSIVGFGAAWNQEVDLARAVKSGKLDIKAFLAREAESITSFPILSNATQAGQVMRGQGLTAGVQSLVESVNPLYYANKYVRYALGLPQNLSKSNDLGDVITQMATGGIGAPAHRDMFGEELHSKSGIVNWDNDPNLEMKTQLANIAGQIGEENSSKFIPKEAPLKLQFTDADGQKHESNLTLAEQEHYQQTTGGYRKDLYGYALSNPEFSKLDANSQAEVLGHINNAIDHKVAIEEFGAPTKEHQSHLLNALLEKDFEAGTSAIDAAIAKAQAKLDVNVESNPSP